MDTTQANMLLHFFTQGNDTVCLLLISDCVLVATFIKVQIYVHPDQFCTCFAWSCVDTVSFAIQMRQMCPEMQVNEMHSLYDNHHKVFSLLKSHLNTQNSVQYEVIWKWHFLMLIHKEQWISLACISGHKWNAMWNWWELSAEKSSTYPSTLCYEHGVWFVSISTCQWKQILITVVLYFYHCYLLTVDTFILFTLSVIFITFNIDNPYDLYAVIWMVLSVKWGQNCFYLPGVSLSKMAWGFMLGMQPQCVTTNES